VGFIAGICIPKIPAQNPLKTHVISEITERGILKFSMARDSFSRFSIYPFPFYFFFSSYHTTIQSLSLTVLHFFLLFVLDLAQSILHL
jgi:hypothetical protein